jgi:hypothetical protein
MMMGLWMGALVAGRSGAAIALHRTTLLRTTLDTRVPAEASIRERFVSPLLAGHTRRL